MTKSMTDPDAAHWRVYLNGALVASAVYGDDERGIVVSNLDPATGHCLWQRGKVEIRIHTSVTYDVAFTRDIICPHCGAHQPAGTNRCSVCQKLIG